MGAAWRRGRPEAQQDGPMVRKLSREGVGYSTADLNHVRYVFANAVPRRSAGVLVETGELSPPSRT